MTTGMLQDTIQTSPSGSGPRFRPYASPNHHVTKGRYITSNDPRGYIPVYEYPLNGQWIMMDIDDGYILWTGIWKALGNSKADIVKMIDSQPDLAPLIRRVRGGYLKIQGTWMPYEVALKLSRRVAWMIRDDLVPLFGPTFPSTCLSPDQPGYGQVVPTSQNRRRPRRTTRNPIMEIPRAPNGWTVVTPNLNMVPPCNTLTTPFHPANVRPSDYHMGSPYPVHSQIRSQTSDIRLSPTMNVKSDSHRYGAYNGHPPPYYRNQVPPSSTKTSLSLDIGFLSMREGNSESRSKEEFSLPPIQTPDGSTHSSFSLPPISSMEEARGIAPQDSAAVLRRLRMDDEGYAREDRTWSSRRHSVSTTYSSPPPPSKSSEPSSRFQPYNTSPRSHHSPTSNHSYHRDRTYNSGRTIPSDTSHEGDSTSDPCPTTSPTTPNSSLSENDHHYRYRHHHHLHLKGNIINHAKLLTVEHPDHHGGHHHQTPHAPDRHGRIIPERPEIISIRRNSCGEYSDTSDPHHRPW